MPSPAQSQSATGTQTSAAGVTTGSISGANQLTLGANYFFGFLIAFVAFLFLFLGVAIVTRRRRAQRRRELLLTGNGLPGDYVQTRPTFWDSYMVKMKGGEEQEWRNIMPLSILSFQHDAKSIKPETSSTLFSKRLDFLASPKRSHEKSASIDASEAEPEPLQVAVLIAMPEAEHEDARGVFEIGVVRAALEGALS